MSERTVDLFPALARPSRSEAVSFPDRTLTYDEVAGAAGVAAEALANLSRVAVWATPSMETVIAVVGALLAGVPVVPINPKAGERELAHFVADSEPVLAMAAPGVDLPGAVGDLDRLDVELGGHASLPEVTTGEDHPALVIYTSGTTGPPKGVVIPRRAIATNLDALFECWRWTTKDVLAHGLPLFHVHGLVLGMLGPLRAGGSVRHLGRFSSEAAGAAIAGGATMLFGVPTMYHRLAADIEENPELAAKVGNARLLVSGSAALSEVDHGRIERAAGLQVIERYGMTETLMNTAIRLDGARRPGTVGPPLGGIRLRLMDDEGKEVAENDEASLGEIQVCGPNLFLGYLNRGAATAEAFADGWFKTGDIAKWDPDGYVRIVGRRATDLIKSGGFKIGAGEIELALAEHPAVADVAVTGEADADLGERVVAWVVPVDRADPPGADELANHVADLLSPHKRPRVVHFLDDLPRNELGKVQKARLRA